jgi:hypothetical protein
MRLFREVGLATPMGRCPGKLTGNARSAEVAGISTVGFLP